jgi:RNA-binding protein
MITGKQRSYLKSLANSIDPIVNIGKNGITENLINQADGALTARELVKFKVLNNTELEAQNTASELAEILGAEFVVSIGRKFVLYRESDEKIITLP